MCHNNVMNRRIILASSSPRRIEMMRNNGYEPEIIPADIDEALPFDMSPEAATMYLAYRKAACAAGKSDQPADVIIIAADTVVVYDKTIIGKPSSIDDAFRILHRLKNSSHDVITGVCIIDTGKNTKECFYSDTKVFFGYFSDEDLAAYVETDEPYDKAGGYAIQGTFGKYADHIEGDYDNVVGFPWTQIVKYIRS